MGRPRIMTKSSPWYKLVTEYLPSVRDQRILEIACGRGGFSRLLASRGARMFGADFSSTALQIASWKIEWRATSAARACGIGASRRSKPALREGLL